MKAPVVGKISRLGGNGRLGNTKFIATDYTDEYRDEKVYSFQSTVSGWGPRYPALKGATQIQKSLTRRHEGLKVRKVNTKFIATDFTDEYRDEKVYSFQSTVYGWGPVSSLKLNAILTPALSILLRAHAGRGEGGMQNTRFTTDGHGLTQIFVDRLRCPKGWLRKYKIHCQGWQG